MSRSTAISLAAAVLAAIAFTFLHKTASGYPPVEETVTVALDTFTLVAIVSIYILLYRHRADSDAGFASMIRDNQSTIILALLINLVHAFYALIAPLIDPVLGIINGG